MFVTVSYVSLTIMHTTRFFKNMYFVYAFTACLAVSERQFQKELRFVRLHWLFAKLIELHFKRSNSANVCCCFLKQHKACDQSCAFFEGR